METPTCLDRPALDQGHREKKLWNHRFVVLKQQGKRGTAVTATNDSSLLRKAGERAGICHLRSAVFYLLPILSRTDNTLLMQRSKVGVVIEITELCCHQPFGRGQKKPTHYCWVTKSFGVVSANKKVSGQILFFENFPEQIITAVWKQFHIDDLEVPARLLNPQQVSAETQALAWQTRQGDVVPGRQRVGVRGPVFVLLRLGAGVKGRGQTPSCGGIPFYWFGCCSS